ncbi:MAG: hypothetical protein ACKOCM_12485 [Cyanobacteriota bacterium]
MTTSASPTVSFAALTVARDFSAWSFSGLQEVLLDLQIFLPGNQHLIRLLQAEIARREDAQPAVQGPASVAALELPF